MKRKIILALALYILGSVYLLSPTPQVPELDGGIRSDEPGDTWQNPDQEAYYTNKVRSEVIPEMQRKFTSQILNYSIPTFRLNYRPEESYQFIRDQVKSYYLEEIVYPLKESLFVSGWEPTNSPEFRHLEEKDKPKVTFKNIVYLSKVTIRPVNSAIWARILVWTLIFPAAHLTFLSLKRSIKA